MKMTKGQQRKKRHEGKTWNTSPLDICGFCFTRGSRIAQMSGGTEYRTCKKCGVAQSYIVK